MKSTRSLHLTRQLTPMSGTSLSPSQNVPQSSRKWRNILKQITINLDLDSLCRFEWCARAIAPFKTGDSKGFEVVGIKSTINCTREVPHIISLELAVLPQNTMPLPQTLTYQSTWKSRCKWWLGWLDGVVLGLLDGSLDGVWLGSLDGVLLGSLNGISLGSFDGVLLWYLDGSLGRISLGSFDGVSWLDVLPLKLK